MLQPNIHTDPLVEILRLAYRRGLQLKNSQSADTTPLNDNLPDARETVTDAARGSNSRNVPATGECQNVTDTSPS